MFSGFRLNPFPIRAAIQIGCDGLVTGTVARMDVAAGALRDAIMHVELPLSVPPTVLGGDGGAAGLLDEASVADATNKLRQVAAATLRYQGVSEAALLLMPPFDRCANSRVMQEAWSRETRARAFLFSEIDFAAELNRRALRAAAVDAQRASGAEHRKKRAEHAAAASSSSHVNSDTDSEVKNIEAAWFLAHAVAAKNVAPHRLLLVSETAGSDDIEVVGCEPSASSSSSPRAAEILRWTVPVSSAECHRILYEEVQRRPMAVYQGARHPVNPVHRSETLHLCARIAERLAADPPPQWVLDRTAGGGVVAGSAPNGFALNTSARVAGSVNVAVERLEQSVEFQYGGLSEALLGNYPLPSLLVPQCCLVAQLCRAMRCRRALYLPEVGVSHAMLAHPLLWTQHAVMTPEQEAARSESAHAQQSSFAYPFQAVDRFQPNRARF